MELDNPSPLVSVIIPTFNSEKTIERTLKSVLMQTYGNLEIIIIDDCSTDSTANLLRKYQTQDSRIKLILKEDNKGVADSRNIGIEKANGKYVAFLDSDDEWYRNKLEIQISEMELNDLSFSYTDYILLDGQNQKVLGIQRSPSTISYNITLLVNMIGCSTVVFNKETIGSVSIPNLEKRNDWALWLEILKKVKKGHHINAELTNYHVLKGSLSSGSKINLLKYHFAIYTKVEKKGFLTVLLLPLNLAGIVIKKLFYFEKNRVKE